MTDPAPQDPTPEPTPTEPPGNPDPAPAVPSADAPLGEAGEKALDAWKTRAKEAEKAAKAHESELEKLRKAAMTEQEKAVAEAKELGRKEALAESGRKVAIAEIKAAAVGKDADALSAQLEFLNVDSFLTEDGDVDAEKVATFVSALPVSGRASVPGVPTGARPGDAGPKQLTKADLQSMSTGEIVAARAAGQLADLQAGRK